MTESVSNSDDLTKEKLAIVVNKLESDSHKSVYKSLNYLRTHVIEEGNGIEKLYRCGGVKSLFKIITSSHEDVVSSALSILGNCCPTLVKIDGFPEEASKAELVSKLCSLLRKTTSVKIQKRIFRLVGNMAHSHALCQELYRLNVVVLIVPIVMSTQCTEVQLAGVRALRWLWEWDKNYMIKHGAVKAVASLLETTNEMVLKAVLRALEVFSKCGNAATEMCGPNGNGYKIIVSNLHLPIVSVLLGSLSYSPFARVELCKAGVVPMIIDKLETSGINSYLIIALCLMCREPMVRASLRKTPNGFKTVLSLLMNPKAKHFYPELLCALAQFIYDQMSLMMMVKIGLINVLVEKLSEHNKTHAAPHRECMSSLAPPFSPASPTSSSIGSLSPPSSSRTFSDSAMYSPRCTTPESDSSETTYANMPKFSSNLDGLFGVDGCILEVLCQLSYQGTPLNALASKTTITTFLEYMVGLRYPQSRHNFLKASSALSSIVKCKHYFNMLLEDESILDIDKYLCRWQHSDCDECKRLEEQGKHILNELSSAAQSGLGEGELTYRLTTGPPKLRTTVSLTIPHVIVNPFLLNSLLFGHNALSILMDALKTRVDEAVPSLHALFKTLSIPNPQTTLTLCTQCEVSSMRKESNISFKLDDGSMVLANRESLSHSCPMFEAMFRGGFIESSQSTIHLTDITPSCLTHLTRILDEYCTCALPKDLRTLLEMVTASDRFLLPHLTTRILSVVMNSALSPLTCPEIYEWGMTTGQQLNVSVNVPIQVVKYLMTAEMASSSRTNAVSFILNGSSADLFTEQMCEIITEGIQSYSKKKRYGTNAAWN